MIGVRMPKPVLVLVAAVVVPSPSHPQDSGPTRAVAITGVAVVDVNGGTVTHDRTVIVADGRIRAIQGPGAAPTDATILDGAGKFLIPGLWDMHVHIRSPLAPGVFFPQFLAHGVTGVRDMASSCPGTPREDQVCHEQLRDWGRRVEAGALAGPRILALASYAVNPPFDGQPTEAEARTLVRSFKSQGLDLIKLYPRLSVEAFGWIMDEAQRAGIRAGGHIPFGVTAIEASNAGLWSLEHARDFLFDCFPGSAAFRAAARSQNPSTEVRRAMVDHHEPVRCEETFRVFVKNGTWYVPTHITRRMDALADDSAFRADSRSRYIPPEMLRSWHRDADGMVRQDPSPEGRRVMHAFYLLGLRVTGRAHAAGVRILLGTDAGDSFAFPGSGAHDELEELVKAGLSPAQALAAATIEPARFLGRESEFGSIEPAKRADLVLLNANPLTDIRNVRSIRAVILGGRVYDREALTRMLADVEARIQALRPRSPGNPRS